MYYRKLIIGVGGFVVGGLAVFGGLSLRVFVRGAPGEGLYPLILGLVTIAASLPDLWIGLRLARGAEKREKPMAVLKQWWTSRSPRLGKVELIVGGLVLQAITAPLLGFFASVFLLVLGLLWILEGKSLSRALPSALGTVLLFYMLFDLVLGLNFPTGLLGI